MIKHTKPKAFYDEFTRKGPGEKSTHYCPGCGHGTAHKLLAEVIDELGVQDNVVFCSPVGCSVFLYYYFDTCNIQSPHGRNPAVATGVSRTQDDSLVISYQGDGDLAGIGIGPIVHAANRGENMTVIFINNAIYGMTGGQMAPTTLLGQKTKTTPLGRTGDRDGFPISMAEMINTLEAPVFVERVSLSTPKNILKARKAFKKALQNQMNKKGFSFVEALAPCPINWKMDPLEARKWQRENLETHYPMKNFRDAEVAPRGTGRLPLLDDDGLFKLLDIDAKAGTEKKLPSKKIDEQEVIVAGFGGQGVMSVGVLLANCATTENYNSTWLPSYGPEMRGGTANASVIVSNDPIGAPVVHKPNVLIALNAPSLDSFEQSVQPGGIIIVNSSLISRKVERDDVKVYYVPATDIAKDIGLVAAAAVVTLAIYSLITKIVGLDTIKNVLPQSIKKENLITANIRAIDSAELYFNDHPIS